LTSCHFGVLDVKNNSSHRVILVSATSAHALVVDTYCANSPSGNLLTLKEHKVLDSTGKIKVKIGDISITADRTNGNPAGKTQTYDLAQWDWSIIAGTRVDLEKSNNLAGFSITYAAKISIHKVQDPVGAEGSWLICSELNGLSDVGAGN